MCLSEQNYFHAGCGSIPCCTKQHSRSLVAMGIKGGKKKSWFSHHHPLTSTLLSTRGASLKGGSTRVGGSLPQNSCSALLYMNVQQMRAVKDLKEGLIC